MEDLHYDRICRTSRSESYLISQGDEPIARVELHYAQSVVYGLLVIEKDVDQIGEAQIQELRDQIDMDLVETADMPRDDFILTVYYGREVGTFPDLEGIADEEYTAEQAEKLSSHGRHDASPR